MYAREAILKDANPYSPIWLGSASKQCLQSCFPICLMLVKVSQAVPSQLAAAPVFGRMEEERADTEANKPSADADKVGTFIALVREEVT